MVSVHMAQSSTEVQQKRCHGCQFEAPATDDQWSKVTHPPLGTLTQCPTCGSTDVRNVD